MRAVAATRVVVLGAGFAGLELSSRLANALGDAVDVTVIDRRDSFVFGFSKLDVMFGHRRLADVRLPYSGLRHPSVRFRQERVVEIDPANRRARTERATYDGDVLVVALGADYDVSATPGLAEGGEEFYSVAGAERLAGVLERFAGGRVVIGVLTSTFKCPPAPSEAAFLLHEFLRERELRERSEITLVFPFGRPIPPSAEASRAITAAFAERGIHALFDHTVRSLDPARKVARLDDGDDLDFDLFLGVPKHRVPEVVETSGLAVDGWVPVDAHRLTTRFEGVYAVGDVTSVPVPKAGVFAERAAAVVAESIIAELRNVPPPPGYDGRGVCYVEMGGGEVGKVEVDFLTGPAVTGAFTVPSEATRAEKAEFAATRRTRWFGQS